MNSELMKRNLKNSVDKNKLIAEDLSYFQIFNEFYFNATEENVFEGYAEFLEIKLGEGIPTQREYSHSISKKTLKVVYNTFKY